jgi:CheY-like chemotaxis protein
MDGLESTRVLRSRGHGLPIIGVSASASKAEQAACLAAGMSDFLPKPIDQDELWGCLTRWLPPRDLADSPDPALESAESRFLGNAESLSKARRVFLEEHSDDTAILCHLLARGDLAAMRHRAHALKGAAAMIGANTVSDLAGEVESGLTKVLAQETLELLIKRLDAALAQYIESLPDH